MNIYKNIKIARAILQAYLHPEESRQQLLEEWAKKAENRKLLEHFQDNDILQQFEEESAVFDIERNWSQLESRIHNRHRIKIRQWRQVAAAVLCLFTLGGGIWLYVDKTSVPVIPKVAEVGGVQLILDNGTTIGLSRTGRDTIVNNAQVIAVTEPQQLAYRFVNQVGGTRYNTLRVPKGYEYRVVLADGTIVRLNSASELKYPIQFTGTERRVFLSGEAFLEVTKDSLHPFYVETAALDIKVYGTKFNVNTHIANIVQTVLVEGAVGIQVHQSGKEYRMSPDQLAEYNMVTRNMDMKDVDVQLYTGWLDGYFIFEEETLERVLNRMALWYDVDFTYTNPQLKNLRVSGSLTHFEDIHQILKAMEQIMDVRFHKDLKTIQVIPK